MKCKKGNLTTLKPNTPTIAIGKKPSKQVIYGLVLRWRYFIKQMQERAQLSDRKWTNFLREAGICRSCANHTGCSQTRRLTFWTLILALSFLFSPVAKAQLIREKSIQVVIGEAADQGPAAMQGVAEVLRRRASYQGFSTLGRRNFRKFVKSQPKHVWLQAEKAWELSAHSNITNGANHFENVSEFGWPSWSKSMQVTAVIDDLVFFRTVK